MLGRGRAMTAEQRRGLEDLVRLRFRLGPPDPVLVTILATSQLVDAGMGRTEAIDVAVRILTEETES
jgi:hypothetical protein